MPRALVVDDTATLRDVARRLLERLGYQCDVADEGFSALALLAAADYQLVLIDVEMPQMDGIEVTRRLRTLRGDSSRAWVVIMSGGAPDIQQRADEAGADAFVQKPMDLASLRSALPAGPSPSPVSERPPEPPAAIDDSVFDEIIRVGKVEFVRKLLVSFDRDADQQVGRMEAGLGEGDHAAVGLAAHALKGAAATLGAVELRELCARIEVFLAAEDEELAATVSNLRPAVSRAQSAWAARLAEAEAEG